MTTGSADLTLIINECAKCGACTAVCPVYQVTGRESLTARGRLHLLKTLHWPATDAELTEILSKCLLCGACRAVCPRGIDIPALIIHARATRPQVTGFSSFKKYLAQQALARPAVLAALSKVARPLGLLPATLPAASGLRLALTPPLLDLSPTAAGLSPQVLTSKTAPTQKALYFSGCLAQHLAPAVGVAAELLLAKLCDFQLLTPGHQGCCGLAAKAAGDLEQAKDLARRTLLTFSGEEVSALPIFTTCASCYASLQGYPELLANDPAWRDQAQAFARRVWEFSSFILQYSPHPAAGFRQDLPARPIVYHDPCHLRWAGITTPPRQLLKLAPGLKCLELPHGPHCCGQGGLFPLAHAELSQRIAKPLVDDFLSTGATLVVSSCSGCLHQWQHRLAATSSKAQATHLALLLAQQLATD